jgi:GNAT superfamily N-acetyltransferase
MTSSTIRLRPIEPSDGPKIATLFTNTPDTGQITFTTRFKADAYAVLRLLHPDMAGVVAEDTSKDQLVGIGLVDLTQRLLNGEPRPCALLHSLKVHPDYRRQGLARQIAQWRIDYARQQFGDAVAISANIQKGNTGSERNAQSWATHFVGPVVTALMRPLDSAPRLPQGLTFRPIKPEEFGAFAEQQRHFYQQYNLFWPQTEHSLQALFEQPIRELYGVFDAAGNLLAGANNTLRFKVLSLEVGRLPGWMQGVNKLIKLLPANGIVDELMVEDLWFAPQQEAAAKALWQHLRYVHRNRASVVRISFDPRSPLAAIFGVPFWFPKAESSFAVYNKDALDSRRLLAPFL